MSKNTNNSNNSKVIVILENCPLEVGKVGGMYRLLSIDEHKNFLFQYKSDPSIYRPDIVHQCLLMLFDSPLCKAGRLKVYIHTQRNVLIEIHELTRIPRTYKRFAGVLVQLLYKFKLKQSNKKKTTSKLYDNNNNYNNKYNKNNKNNNEENDDFDDDNNNTNDKNRPISLFKVIQNPITKHLPPDCKIITFSREAKKMQQMNKEWVIQTFIEENERKKRMTKGKGKEIQAIVTEQDSDSNESDSESESDEDNNNDNDNDNKKEENNKKVQKKIVDEDICFVVGGFSHGHLNCNYSNSKIAISKYPLSAAVCCSRICQSFEDYWEIY